MRLVDNLDRALGERPGSTRRGLMEELEQRLRAHLVKAGQINTSEEFPPPARGDVVAHTRVMTIAGGGG